MSEEIDFSMDAMYSRCTTPQQEHEELTSTDAESEGDLLAFLHSTKRNTSMNEQQSRVDEILKEQTDITEEFMSMATKWHDEFYGQPEYDSIRELLNSMRKSTIINYAIGAMSHDIARLRKEVQ